MKIHRILLTAAVLLSLVGVEAQQQHQQQQRRDSDQEAAERRRLQRQERQRQQRKKARQEFRQKKQGAGDEGEYDELLIQLQEFARPFFPQRPRGPLQGTLNAIKNALAGAALSFGFFVGGVGGGYAHAGFVGMIVGSIVGSLSAFFTSLAFGAKVVYNLFFGLIATPACLDAAIQGKMWDDTQREWIIYSLKQEAEDLEKRRKSSATGGTRNTHLYDILGVEPTATQKEIKSAYRKKALLVHPDKNPDSETAEEEFLQLFNAYSTLSDDKRRADYDRYGASTDGTISKVFDARVFFAVLLDADAVEPYVGELRVSFYINKIQEFVLLAKSFQDNDNGKNQQSELFMSMLEGWSDDSRRRYIDIANHLATFVEVVATGNMTDGDFMGICREEAEKIFETMFGSKFLKIMGNTLTREVNLYLGYDFPWLGLPQGVFTSASQIYDRNERRIRAFNQFRQILAKYEPDESNDKSKIVKVGDKERVLDLGALHVILPDIVEFAWSLIEMDISAAIHEACNRLFHDSVGRSLGHKRARALRVLGNAMLAVEKEKCVDEEFSHQAFQERLDQAYRLAILQQKE